MNETATSEAAPEPPGPPAPAPAPTAAPDPSVSIAFGIGWRMGWLYREASFEKERGEERNNPLPGFGEISPFSRTRLAVEQIETGLEKLRTHPMAAGIPPVSTEDLETALQAEPGALETLRQEIKRFHTDVLVALTAADFRLGRAYGLGHALAGTCLGPEDRASFDRAFGARIVQIKTWLADLASTFPPHASRAVVLSLRAWETWAAAPVIDGQPLDWASQGPGVRAGLRRQGELWRALLTGEKNGQDMLSTSDYLDAARNLMAQTIKMLGRFKGPLAVVGVFTLLLGVGVGLLVAAGSSIGQLAGAIVTAAGAVGITGAGLRARLTQVTMQLEARLWGACLDLAIARAVLNAPAGWGLAVAEVDVPATGAEASESANLTTLAEFREAIARYGGRTDQVQAVEDLLAPAPTFVAPHETVSGLAPVAAWVVHEEHSERLSKKPDRQVAAGPGIFVTYVGAEADVWRVREGKIAHWQAFPDHNSAREAAGLPPILELTPDEASALLARYRPFLRYDSQESYFADSAAAMTDSFVPHDRANVLRRADGAVLASADPADPSPTLNLDLLAATEYANGAEVRADDYLDATGRGYVLDARRMHALPGYADRVYGHVVVDYQGRQWLQYWFFYYYNDKALLGVGLHEGDWEMIQIGLAVDRTPELVTLSQHKGGQRCAWSDVELAESPDGPAPVIYVARGSHANHLAPGKYEAPVVPDYCDGGGALIRPTLEEVEDSGPAWVLWPGTWGSTHARSPLESDSPRGPHTKRQWKDPAAYHARATLTTEVLERAAATQAVPGPPRPDNLQATRTDEGVTIDYEFPAPDAGQPAPSKLVLTVDRLDDELPAASFSLDVSGLSGSAQHPMQLEDGPYEIRATAYSEDGHASPVATLRP